MHGTHAQAPTGTVPLIQAGDCLHVLLCDLTDQARHLPPPGSGHRRRWIDAAAMILAQVPHWPQRLAWATQLVEAVSGRQQAVGVCVNTLLRRAAALEMS